MEETQPILEPTKRFLFVMETLYMPNIYVMTARKAVIRLDDAGMLELVTLSVDGSKYEQVFKISLEQVTKINTVLSMTYIHLGSKMFRLYDKPIYNVADMNSTIEDTAMLPLLNEAPAEEVITGSKQLAKKFNALHVRGFYTGMALISLYTVVGIAVITAVIVIFAQTQV